jgi:hypothetical protein
MKEHPIIGASAHWPVVPPAPVGDIFSPGLPVIPKAKGKAVEKTDSQATQGVSFTPSGS